MNGGAGAARSGPAAGPLRAAAAVRALASAVGVVCYLISWLWPLDSSGSMEAVLRRVEILAAVQRWSALGCAGVMLIALAQMFSALQRRARALAAGAVAATALMLALLVFTGVVRGQIARIAPNHFPALLEAIWFTQLVASHAGPLLALLAAAAAVPAGTVRRGATVAYAALVALLLVLRVSSFVWMPAAAFGRALSVVMLVLEAAAMVPLVLAAFWRARALELSAAPPTAAPDAAPGRLDPGPLRLLGRTIIVRIAVGAPLAIIASVGAARGAPDAAMLALVAGTVTSLVVTAMLLMSLAGQRQLPAALCDREALMIAIVLACLAPVLDIWSAVTTGQLLSLVGEAKRATSFWGMPGLGRIEDLQAAANWTGRISICLGLAGSFAIVRSLTATARGLVDETLAVRARRVRALLIYGTGGAVTAWIFVSNVQLRGDGALMALVLIAVGLLTIGIVLCVELLRLIFGLANAIERRPPAAEVSPAFPS